MVLISSSTRAPRHRLRLGVLAAVTALIVGGSALVADPASAAESVTVDAATLATSVQNNGVATPDGSARSGKALLFYSNGATSFTMKAPTALSTLAIRAR